MEEADGSGKADEGSMHEEEDTDDEDYDIWFDDENVFDGTSTTLCEEFWLQLQRDDPNLTSMTVSWNNTFTNTIDWRNESHYIGINTHVNKMIICRMEEELDTDGGADDVIEFCKGLACNRSIEHLILSECHFLGGFIFAYLWPFFEKNNSLRQIDIIKCKMEGSTAFLLSSALMRSQKRKESSLEVVRFEQNRMSDIDYERACAKLIHALKEHVGIKKISLASNEPNEQRSDFIGRIGCEALGSLLQSPLCNNIVALDLSNSNVNDEGISVFSEMLVGNNTLRKLRLSGNEHITAIGWNAFSTVLKSSTSSLTALELDGNSIDNEGAAALAVAFEKNNTLRYLDLGINEHITAVGWGAFTTFSSLKVLAIHETDIDDEGVMALGNTLAKSTKLQDLHFSLNQNIGTDGWRAFFSSLLSNPNSALKKLLLVWNYIDDEGVAALANVLENNKTLKFLDLSKNVDISPNGWRAFFTSLQHSNCGIETIRLESNNIDDEGAADLAALLISSIPLKSLDLGDNEDITTEGWLVLSSHLRGENCVLRELHMDGIILSNEALHAFANALIQNCSLRELRTSNIFSRGFQSIDTDWSAITNVLCDKSSIDATITSNHTLEQLCRIMHETLLPKDLLFLLQLNRNNTRSETIRKKILYTHFLNDCINDEKFMCMDLPSLPIAMSWIGRDDIGFPVLYRLLRCMPSLFDSSEKVKSFGMKRKRV